MTSLPNALVIGPMKAGTTWLHDYLALRGDVCLPAGVKETLFFDHRFHRGEHWYASHFRQFDPHRHRAVLEVASSCFHCRAAPERIRKTLGTIPLIIVLRDPVGRAWSHYLHLSRKGYTRQPLRQAVRQYPEIVTASRYHQQISQWQRAFGRDSLHFLRYDDLIRNPDEFARSLCDALGLPFMEMPQEARGRSNEATVPPSPLFAMLAQRLANRLRDRGIYGLVNAGKRVGLKSVFFGKPNSRALLPSLSEEDRTWLSTQCADGSNSIDFFMRPKIEPPHKKSRGAET